MRHHAFVIEAGVEDGINIAEQWQEQELGMQAKNNPDVIVLKYGLFSVEDARRVQEVAMQAPLAGTHKVIVIAATRLYHEAQNALLKLFEEPPEGTYLFLIIPSAGSLLPTLRSRVQIFTPGAVSRSSKQQGERIHELIHEFLQASVEKRSAMIKKLATGKDDEERRENRDKALAIVNGIEQVATKDVAQHQVLLREVAQLRDYLYDRSAPVKMILEHLSLVLPSGLDRQ